MYKSYRKLPCFKQNSRAQNEELRKISVNGGARWGRCSGWILTHFLTQDFSVPFFIKRFFIMSLTVHSLKMTLRCQNKRSSTVKSSSFISPSTPRLMFMSLRKTFSNLRCWESGIRERALLNFLVQVSTTAGSIWWCFPRHLVLFERWAFGR